MIKNDHNSSIVAASLSIYHLGMERNDQECNAKAYIYS